MGTTEVGPEGELLSFTQALYTSPAHPVERPIYGLIRLKGADSALLHLIGEVSIENLKTGTKMAPVLKESRQGQILDILYFRPAGGSHE